MTEIAPLAYKKLMLVSLNCAEGVHRVGGVVTFAVATVYFVAGHAVVGLYIALVALLLHAYPVMLQRRNRGHVLRLTRRLDALRQGAHRKASP